MGTAPINKKHYQQQQHMVIDIKLAPPVQHAVIIGEKQVDQKIWYIVQVVPLRTEARLIKSSKSAISRKPYTIARRYDEFVQFSQKLNDDFSTDALSHHPPALSSRAGQRMPMTALPKLSNSGSGIGGKRLQILQNKKHMQQQRRTDLDTFIDVLFRLQPLIVQSLTVREFFGQKKYDALSPSPSSSRLLRAQSSMTRDQVLSSSSSLRRSISHPELVHDAHVVVPASNGSDNLLDQRNRHQQQQQQSPPPPLPPMTPLWRRFRARGQASIAATATEATARPLPQPSSSLTVLCNQAANMIMPWKQQQQQQQQQQRQSPPPMPSRSTPIAGAGSSRRMRKQPSFQPPPLPRSNHYPTVTSSSIMSSTSTGSSCYSRDSQSTSATSLSPSPTTSPTLRMIKIKIVYDVDNIIVVQVPRTASLEDLRQRILQKFSDLALNPEFSLVFNDTRSSASSGTGAADAILAADNGAVVSSTSTLIEKEEDFMAAMGTVWVRLDKVTLRCIVP